MTPTATPHTVRRNNREPDQISTTRLNTPGMSGLYDGQENEDEEVQFTRAARRLWAWNTARGAARNGDDTWEATPEREIISLADVDRVTRDHT